MAITIRSSRSYLTSAFIAVTIVLAGNGHATAATNESAVVLDVTGPHSLSVEVPQPSDLVVPQSLPLSSPAAVHELRPANVVPCIDVQTPDTRCLPGRGPSPVKHLASSADDGLPSRLRNRHQSRAALASISQGRLVVMASMRRAALHLDELSSFFLQLRLRPIALSSSSYIRPFTV